METHKKDAGSTSARCILVPHQDDTHQEKEGFKNSSSPVDPVLALDMLAMQHGYSDGTLEETKSSHFPTNMTSRQSTNTFNLHHRLPTEALVEQPRSSIERPTVLMDIDSEEDDEQAVLSILKLTQEQEYQKQEARLLKMNVSESFYVCKETASIKSNSEHNIQPLTMDRVMATPSDDRPASLYNESVSKDRLESIPDEHVPVPLMDAIPLHASNTSLQNQESTSLPVQGSTTSLQESEPKHVKRTPSCKKGNSLLATLLKERMNQHQHQSSSYNALPLSTSVPETHEAKTRSLTRLNMTAKPSPTVHSSSHGTLPTVITSPLQDRRTSISHSNTSRRTSSYNMNAIEVKKSGMVKSPVTPGDTVERYQQFIGTVGSRRASISQHKSEHFLIQAWQQTSTFTPQSSPLSAVADATRTSKVSIQQEAQTKSSSRLPVVEDTSLVTPVAASTLSLDTRPHLPNKLVLIGTESITLRAILNGLTPPPADLKSFRAFCQHDYWNQKPSLSPSLLLEFWITAETLKFMRHPEEYLHTIDLIFSTYFNTISFPTSTKKDAYDAAARAQVNVQNHVYDYKIFLEAQNYALNALEANVMPKFNKQVTLKGQDLEFAEKQACWWKYGNPHGFFSFPSPVSLAETRLYSLLTFLLLLTSLLLEAFSFHAHSFILLFMAVCHVSRMCFGARLDPLSWTSIFVLHPLVIQWGWMTKVYQASPPYRFSHALLTLASLVCCILSFLPHTSIPLYAMAGTLGFSCLLHTLTGWNPCVVIFHRCILGTCLRRICTQATLEACQYSYYYKEQAVLPVTSERFQSITF